MDSSVVPSSSPDSDKLSNGSGSSYEKDHNKTSSTQRIFRAVGKFGNPFRRSSSGSKSSKDQIVRDPPTTIGGKKSTAATENPQYGSTDSVPGDCKSSCDGELSISLNSLPVIDRPRMPKGVRRPPTPSRNFAPGSVAMEQLDRTTAKTVLYSKVGSEHTEAGCTPKVHSGNQLFGSSSDSHTSGADSQGDQLAPGASHFETISVAVDSTDISSSAAGLSDISSSAAGSSNISSSAAGSPDISPSAAGSRDTSPSAAGSSDISSSATNQKNPESTEQTISTLEFEETSTSDETKVLPKVNSFSSSGSNTSVDSLEIQEEPLPERKSSRIGKNRRIPSAGRIIDFAGDNKPSTAMRIKKALRIFSTKQNQPKELPPLPTRAPVVMLQSVPSQPLFSIEENDLEDQQSDVSSFRSDAKRSTMSQDPHGVQVEEYDLELNTPECELPEVTLDLSPVTIETIDLPASSSTNTEDQDNVSEELNLSTEANENLVKPAARVKETLNKVPVADSQEMNLKGRSFGILAAQSMRTAALKSMQVSKSVSNSVTKAFAGQQTESSANTTVPSHTNKQKSANPSLIRDELPRTELMKSDAISTTSNDTKVTKKPRRPSRGLPTDGESSKSRVGTSSVVSASTFGLREKEEVPETVGGLLSAVAGGLFELTKGLLSFVVFLLKGLFSTSVAMFHATKQIAEDKYQERSERKRLRKGQFLAVFEKEEV